MKQFFGTDGIRGVAGEPPLDAATIFAIGLALGDDLGPKARLVLGEDTRESSAWIAETLAAALADRGLRVDHAGVLPTPGVAHLTARENYAAGVMISASHNPFQDNGIKVFGASGFKLPDEEEAAIERGILRYRAAGVAPRRAPLPRQPPLLEHYVAALAEHFAQTDFSALSVVVDCAHGAASAVAGPLVHRLGLKAELLACQPNGRNINAGVGALHPEGMAACVRGAGAAAGVALDGDADRAILADDTGTVVNGDAVLLMCARELRASGQLEPAIVVGTVMTNLGLELALRRDGIRLERAAVGDKYVLEKMQELGAVLGGEPSGHIIFGAEATTGDGLRTALHCFDLMARRRQPLRALCAGLEELPQQIVNVRVREKTPLSELHGVQAAIRAAETHFHGSGRVLVRYSGTEKLARVMVEAESAAAVAHHAQAIAAALRATIGE